MAFKKINAVSFLTQFFGQYNNTTRNFTMVIWRTDKQIEYERNWFLKVAETKWGEVVRVW